MRAKPKILSPAAMSGFSFSKKLSKGDKELLAKWTEGLAYEGMRPLLRTNAPKALKAELLSELETLALQMQKVILDAEKARPGTLLYEPEPFYVTMLRDLYTAPDRLWSDIPLAAEKLEGFPHENEEICYTGRSLSLAVLYELGRDIDRLLAKKVWLKSGAYLVIEKTEAFVSIDVNSGRFEKGKIAEETYRKINLEAAEEIVTQVILRNLSGMILVDFIKLSNPDHREELVNVMRKHAKRDRLSMDVVDRTPLGIMEIVREKREKPLSEILKT
jgi:ribonuclease G